MKKTFAGLALWIIFICSSLIQCMDNPNGNGLPPLYSEASKLIWLQKGVQQGRIEMEEELKESEAKFKGTHRELNRLLGIDLIQSELRNTELKADLSKTEQRNTELKDEIGRKIEELSGIVQEMEESHPCAKQPIPQLRRLIEDLKRVASK